MSDSRTFSLSKIQQKMQRQTKTIMFLSSVIVSFVLVYVLRGDDFTKTQDYTLFLLFFSIGLWVTEAIPPFAVGIMIIGFLVFSMGNMPGVDVKKYVNTWSDGVIWLFLGGFFLAEAMKKAKLDEGLLKLVMPRLGNAAPKIVLGMMMLTAFLSMLMSNTATTSMVLATLVPLSSKFGKESPVVRALFVGVPAAASIGGMGTIIGSAPNAIAVGALEGLGIHISFIQWMMVGLPVALFLVYLFYRILYKKYQLKTHTLNMDFLFKKDESNNNENENKNQKRIVLVVMCITLFLWLTSQWTKIPVAVVSGLPIVLLTMLQIIDSEDVRKLPWDTLMLVAGGLSLGLAIQEQGIATYFVDSIGHFNMSYYGLLILFAFVTVIFSNFMSNTAAATILIPVGISLLSIIPGGNTAVLPIVIGLCASCSLLLPVSTPPNAVAYSMGVLDQKDFYRRCRAGGDYSLVIIFHNVYVINSLFLLFRKKNIFEKNKIKKLKIHYHHQKKIIMKLQNLFFVLCLCIFISCKSDSSKTAYEYSESIVEKEQALAADITETESSVGKFFEENKPDSAKIASDKMADIVQKSIDEIKNTNIPEGVKGGEDFKKSALEYFEKIKSVYISYANLAANWSDQTAVEKESQNLINIIAEKDKASDEIYAAQVKFAKENNFNLAEKN